MMKSFKELRPYLADLGRLLAAVSLALAAIATACELARPGLAMAVVSPKVLVALFVLGGALALLEEKNHSSILKR